MPERKLKIAVQMYGHLRTYEVCAPFLKRYLLDHYDCDVFIHTWDRTEHSTKSWYQDSVRGDPLAVTEEVIANVHKLYAPKKLDIQTQDFVHEEGAFGTHPTIRITLTGLKYMLYSQNRANTLRLDYEAETGTRYDYVVVIRPDIMLFAAVDFELYRKEFDFYNRVSIHFVHNSVIVLNGRRFFNYPLVFDCFYFSTPDVITTITDCYTQFDRFFKTYTNTLPEGMENPETALCEYMVENAVSPRQYQFYFAIKRKNDKDDIKLLPPVIKAATEDVTPAAPPLLVEELRYYQLPPPRPVRSAIKRVLRVFVKHTPRRIRNAVRRPLALAVRLNNHLEMLENKRDV